MPRRGLQRRHRISKLEKLNRSILLVSKWKCLAKALHRVFDRRCQEWASANADLRSHNQMLFDLLQAQGLQNVFVGLETFNCATLG